MEQYYYNRMNKIEQAVYHALYQGFLNIDEEIQIPRLEGEALYNVFFKLRLDHPEIFWATGYKYKYYNDSPNLIFVPEYLFEKAKTIYRFDAIDSIKERVPIQVNKLYHDYTNADKIEAEYINVENPEDGKVFVEVDENGYVVRIVEKGKNIYTKIFKHYSYDMINYAIVRDVLLRKHMEEMRINDIADARVVEATRTDLKKLYSDIEISVNNKEFAYILDGHEKFNNT